MYESMSYMERPEEVIAAGSPCFGITGAQQSWISWVGIDVAHL
jgi:hypothetical protein